MIQRSGIDSEPRSSLGDIGHRPDWQQEVHANSGIGYESNFNRLNAVMESCQDDESVDSAQDESE
ncbi:hypothetical protein D3C73_1335340 [compost metagenome]